MWTVATFPLSTHGVMRQPIVVFQDLFGIDLNITHAVNSGAAWGMFASFPQALVVLRFVLIAALLGYLLFFNTQPSWRVPLVLIISGAIGNVIDYFLYGYVVDMIHVSFWGYNYPVFNVADSTIFVGAVWIVLSTLFEKSGKVA